MTDATFHVEPVHRHTRVVHYRAVREPVYPKYVGLLSLVGVFAAIVGFMSSFFTLQHWAGALLLSGLFLFLLAGALAQRRKRLHGSVRDPLKWVVC